MKIAFISTLSFYPWGGSEAYWHILAMEACEQNHAVSVSVYTHQQIHPKIAQLKKAGAQIFFRSKESAFRRIIKRISPHLLKNPYSAIIQSDPDLVIVSQGGTFEVANNKSIAEWLGKTTIPYVIICHGNSESITLNDQKRLLAKSLFQKARYVLFPAEWAIALCSRQLLTPLSNTRLFSNPLNLDPSIEPNSPKDIAKESINLAMVGSLTLEWKGQDIALQVLSKPKWRSRNWTLSIYGEGKDRAYIRGLIEFLKLGDRVILKGYENDIRKIWQENDLHLMPSRIETAPISIVEAMVCGIPTVTTNIGGISEWIVEGVGYMAKAPNAHEFEIALEKAFSERTQWDHIGHAARIFALEKIRKSTITLSDLL